MFLLIFVAWAFVALLVRADASRRYGRELAGHFFVTTAVLPFLGVPYYVIFRVGHAAGQYPLDRIAQSMPWNARP